MKILVNGKIKKSSYVDKNTNKKVYAIDLVIDHHEFCESKKE